MLINIIVIMAKEVSKQKYPFYWILRYYRYLIESNSYRWSKIKYEIDMSEKIKMTNTI